MLRRHSQQHILWSHCISKCGGHCKKRMSSLQCVDVFYLCMRAECCSTATGVQGCSRWWPRPAARSLSGRRSPASLRPGKRPSPSSARWWRRRRGSGTARTFQLRGRTISFILSCIFFKESKQRHMNALKQKKRQQTQAGTWEKHNFVLHFMPSTEACQQRDNE